MKFLLLANQVYIHVKCSIKIFYTCLFLSANETCDDCLSLDNVPSVNSALNVHYKLKRKDLDKIFVLGRSESMKFHGDYYNIYSLPNCKM